MMQGVVAHVHISAQKRNVCCGEINWYSGVTYCVKEVSMHIVVAVDAKTSGVLATFSAPLSCQRNRCNTGHFRSIEISHIGGWRWFELI